MHFCFKSITSMLLLGIGIVLGLQGIAIGGESSLLDNEFVVQDANIYGIEDGIVVIEAITLSDTNLEFTISNHLVLGNFDSILVDDHTVEFWNTGDRTLIIVIDDQIIRTDY